MDQSAGLLIALAMLIIAVVVHIVAMARWSGRMDASRETTLAQQEELSHIWERRFDSTNQELLRLRERQHKLEGDNQRHEGMLRMLMRGAGFEGPSREGG